jgi:hypothetical protein
VDTYEGMKIRVRGVDLGECFVDSQVKPDEQLSQGLSAAANEHGQVVMSVGGGGDTANRTEHAEGDLPVGNQLRDVRQGRRKRTCY